MAAGIWLGICQMDGVMKGRWCVTPINPQNRWPSTNWLGLLTLKMGSLQEHFALSAGLCRVRDCF
jgi:hypothetical protein